MTALDLTFPFENAEPAPVPGVRPDHFKEALARLAGGVAIITCWTDDAPVGILVSSITGLSLDPPRYLFCVRREASAHDALIGARLCGVSILSAGDEDEAATFVDPGLRSMRFASARWRRTATFPPVLDGALSSAICLVDTVINAGSHSIVLAAAQSLEISSGQPLLSYNRDLRRLQPRTT